jgi:hypothetical protein
MKNIKNIFLSAWAPLIFILISSIGVLAFFHDIEKNTSVSIYKLYEVFGISATGAISLLAFFAYIQFGFNQYMKKRYLSNLEIKDNETKAALMIQFGGKNESPEMQMKGFCRHSLNIKDEYMMFQSFGKDGDSGYKIVEPQDISDLKDYLRIFQKQYHNINEVHILIQGIGITYAVCMDLFSNSKPLFIYHFQKGNYEMWYRSQKDTPRPADVVNDKQIA